MMVTDIDRFQFEARLVRPQLTLEKIPPAESFIHFSFVTLFCPSGDTDRNHSWQCNVYTPLQVSFLCRVPALGARPEVENCSSQKILHTKRQWWWMFSSSFSLPFLFCLDFDNLTLLSIYSGELYTVTVHGDIIQRFFTNTVKDDN